VPFEVYDFESRIADKYAKVLYANNLYSSSPKYAKDTVYVKATSNEVFILNQDYELIMEHPRLYGKGKESMKWLPYLELMSKRPTALKYTSFYEELPDNWRKYLSNQNSEGKRKGLISLHTMLSKHDMGTAADVLNFAISNGTSDADSILMSWRVLTSDVQPLQPLQLNQNLTQMPVFKTNNQKYDHLFQKEVHS